MSKNNNQPTYKRQRFLLAFLRQMQDDVTSTDLQKLVFLHTIKEESEFYKFIPYKYGPYSFQLAKDVDILHRDGYVSIKSNPESTRIKAVGEYLQKDSFQIASERGNNLIRKAYREYPYYAINSEITGRLFNGEELKRFNNGRQAYVQTEQVLFTIGYEGKNIEEFINILIQNDIRLLCDVRKNPLSRKFGFSKSKLKHITGTVGIKYVHIPDLGIESNKRKSLEAIQDYKCLFSYYTKKLPNLTPSLEQVFSLLRSKVRIVLMCYEKEPEMCHRHVIRNYITNTHTVRSVDL